MSGRNNIMNNFFNTDPQTLDIESEDFAHTSLLQKIQNGEDVASEEFQHFIIKGKELIHVLQKSLLNIGLV
jgi:hypothetical protein